MRSRAVLWQVIVFASLAAASAAVAASTWQKDDPSQWTSEDVYQILNNSPWSKSVKVTVARGAGYDNQGRGGGGGPWGEGMPGGMGRGGGMGGGGMGRGRGGYPSSQQEGPTVTVRWVSALPVRLAEAKSAGGPVDAAAMKPLNQYIIAVMDFPKSGFGSSGSNSPDSDTDDERLADHLKTITVLSIGHEKLNPTKVEFNQGRDARTVFYFDKSEAVTVHDKDAEFRVTGERMEIRRKFTLKDMEYRGNLEL